MASQLSFTEELEARNGELGRASDQLAQDGGLRFTARLEITSHGGSCQVQGIRLGGYEYLPASFADWLLDETTLIRRKCEDCQKHPRGRCDFCATQGD